MKITIFGSGYVGLVTGACLADAGNHVVCVDVDERKTAMLKRGEMPIHEPGLDARGQAQFRGGPSALHHQRRGRRASTGCSS